MQLETHTLPYTQLRFKDSRGQHSRIQSMTKRKTEDGDKFIF